MIPTAFKTHFYARPSLMKNMHKYSWNYTCNDTGDVFEMIHALHIFLIDIQMPLMLKSSGLRYKSLAGHATKPYRPTQASGIY